MIDHTGYSYPPFAAYGALLLLRGLWNVLNEPKRTAPPATPPQRVIVTPPPAPTPVVRWTSDRELIAWRVWRLARWGPDNGLRLLSMSANWVWDGPVFGADFLPCDSDASHSGVYAIKGRPFRAIDWLWSADCWVLGWVALSGRVIEHRFGYRAERAVVRRLRLGVGTHLNVTDDLSLCLIQIELEQRYQAPVSVGGLERRIARSLLLRNPALQQGGIGFARPDKGWRLG